MINSLNTNQLLSYYQTIQAQSLNSKGEKQPSASQQNPNLNSSYSGSNANTDIIEFSQEALKKSRSYSTPPTDVDAELLNKKVYIPEVLSADNAPTIEDYLSYGMPKTTSDGTDNSRTELPSIIKLPTNYTDNPDNNLPGATIGISGNKATVILDVNFESKRTKELEEKRVIEEKRLKEENTRVLQSTSMQTTYQAASFTQVNENGMTVVNINMPVTQTIINEQVFNLIQKPANGSGPVKIRATYTIQEEIEQINPIKIMKVMQSANGITPESEIAGEKNPGSLSIDQTNKMKTDNPLSFSNLIQSVKSMKSSNSNQQKAFAESALSIMA